MASETTKRGVRALCIILCVAGLTVAAAVMWGGWAALFAVCVAYGVTCLVDGIEAAINGLR